MKFKKINTPYLKEELKLVRITTVPVSLKYLLRGQFKHFSSLGFDVVAVSADGPEIEEFVQEEGVSHRVIPLTRKITPFKDLYCIFKLYALIRREKATIVHTHTPKAGLIGMIAAYLARVPVRMHTVAGLPLMGTAGMKKKVLIGVEEITYRFATNVYPNSHALKNFIKQNICDDDNKIKVIANGSSNGIDTQFFKRTPELEEQAKAIRSEHGISEDAMVAIFIGRITGDKGMNELMSAMSQIKTLKLFLVGDFEPDLDPLSPEAMTELNGNPDIIWVGFRSDVRPYLMAADFLVFPSYREGFPNVPLQAGALGLPGVLTDINGCNELVEHGVNGLLIEPRNAVSLEKAISRLMNEPELFASMKREARRMVEERYGREVVWKALEEEYSQLTRSHV
ncbi:MAG: glycosyltransferase family 4 protein [Roseivirga sp.]